MCVVIREWSVHWAALSMWPAIWQIIQLIRKKLLMPYDDFLFSPPWASSFSGLLLKPAPQASSSGFLILRPAPQTSSLGLLLLCKRPPWTISSLGPLFSRAPQTSSSGLLLLRSAPQVSSADFLLRPTAPLACSADLHLRPALQTSSLGLLHSTTSQLPLQASTMSLLLTPPPYASSLGLILRTLP